VSGERFFAVGALAWWACAPSEKVKPADWGQVPVAIELRLAKGAPAPGFVRTTVNNQSDAVYLDPKAALSNSHISRVEAVKTRIGKGLILQVWLTKAGAERIADVTAHHMGDSLAVLVNSVVVAVPTIRDTINPGTKRSFDIGVPLEPEQTGRLARAVAKTWRVQRGKE
jgi:preprotein translocase subunit SecD